MATLRRLTGWSLSLPQAGPQDQALRRLIDAALADPARGPDDSAFSLVADLFALMDRYPDRTKGIEPGDVQRLALLVADARVITGLERLPAWKLNADDAAMPALRDALLRRLLRKADHEQTLRALAGIAGRLPAGVFATPNELLDRVLADATLREFGGLVTRLADRGPEVADQLIEIVRTTYAVRREFFYPEGAAPAAMLGLCRLGPAASTKLPTLQQMAAQGQVPANIQRHETWRVMLYALGVDPTSFAPDWDPKRDTRFLRDRALSHGCRLA